MKKLFEKLPSFFYPIVWLLAIVAFTALIVFMYIEKDIAKYISALAILLSAFLAALSVLKSIQNSRQSEINGALTKKKSNLVFVDFLLLDIYRQINYIHSETNYIYSRHQKLHNNNDTSSQIERKIKLLMNVSKEYLIKTINDRNNQLIDRRIKLEDKEILHSLDEGQRICLFEISGNLLSLEQIFSHVKNSNSENSLSSYIESANILFDSITSWIKFMKDDIQKQFPDLRIQSIEEYEKLHTKKDIQT